MTTANISSLPMKYLLHTLTVLQMQTVGSHHKSYRSALAPADELRSTDALASVSLLRRTGIFNRSQIM